MGESNAANAGKSGKGLHFGPRLGWCLGPINQEDSAMDRTDYLLLKSGLPNNDGIRS